MKTSSDTLGPLVITNGMFIIDDIYEQDGEVHKDIPGGGGMFAMLGASTVASSPQISQNLKWIVDRGFDFPPSLTTILESWGTGVHFRDDDSRYTTRGGNFYKNENFREFKYLTPKRQVKVQDWFEIWGFKLLSWLKCVHLLCSPERCLQILDELADLHLGPKTFVWEPIPDLCDQEHAPQIMQVLQRSEDIIFSPNAEEGARFLGEAEPLQLNQCQELIWKIDRFIASHHSCVLRCGKMGSVALSSKDTHTQTRRMVHYPAFHSATPEKVIDPTGGGNSFLGGFCLGYSLTNDMCIASICGNLAAGCIIEQVGIPHFNKITREWNGVSLEERIDHYLQTYQIFEYTPADIYNRLSP